jgi:GNAT superfamily N-acetyltransferase
MRCLVASPCRAAAVAKPIRMGVSFKRATVADAPLLADMRIEFMRIVKDGGSLDEEDWRPGLTGYFSRGLRRESIHAWLCLEDEVVIATAALKVLPVRKGRGAEGLRDGYIMSVYTRPGYRRRGIAARLLSMAIAEARLLGLRRLSLHPTEEGLALYRGLGFRPFRSVMILNLV